MSFWWTDLKVRMPFIGLIAKNSKNHERGNKGWLFAEEKLCGTYKKFVSQISEDKFLQRIEYMKHAGDLGRTPMSTGLTLFLFLLVAAEAMGFSYILGTWAATEGSANLHETLMYGIVFVLASILARITHNAGAQFYRTNLIRSCYRRYKEDHGEDYSTKPIALSDDQMADVKEPPYTRCVNRIIENPDDKGHFGWVWTTVVFVLLVFIGSGVMRYQHMQSDLISKTQVAEAAATNPFASSASLPTEVVAPQQQADKQARNEMRSSELIEGSAAIIILGLIFVVTQIVGFGASYKHCFAGKETYKKTEGSNAFWWWSEKDGAYADTWGYSTYDRYWEAMQPIKDIVNTRLKELQHRLKASAHKNLDLTNTFEDYLFDMADRSRPGARSRTYQDERGQLLSESTGSGSQSITLADKAEVLKNQGGGQVELATKQTEGANSIVDTVACPTCNKMSVAGTKFCGDCGAKIVEPKLFCTGCGKELKPGTKFCGDCGTKA